MKRIVSQLYDNRVADAVQRQDYSPSATVTEIHDVDIAEERRNQLLMDFSSNLPAIVAQRFIPTSDGKRRRAAMEILIKTLMGKSRELGMRTFALRAIRQVVRGCIGEQDVVGSDLLAHVDYLFPVLG